MILRHIPNLCCRQGLALSGAALLLGLSSGLHAQEPTPSPTPADIKVTVVATRSEEPTLETPGSTAAITADEIRARGSVTLTDALLYEPGVSVPFDFAGQSGFVPYLGGGDQGVNIRGLEGNRVAIRFDGIRQPEDFVAQTFLGAGGPGRIYFDPAVLNQVEIYKSSNSSLYGSDALGGVVDTRSMGPDALLGAEWEGTAVENTVTYASVNDSINNRLAAAVGDGNRAASLIYSYRTASERENNGNDPVNPQDYDSHAAILKGGVRGDTWRLLGTVDFFSSSSFTDGDAAEGVFFGGAIVNDTITLDESRDRLRLSLEGFHQPDGGSPLADQFTWQAYYQDSEAASFNVQQGTLQFGPFPSPRDRRNDIRYQTEIFGLDFQAEKLFSAAGAFHELRYGAEVSQSEVKSEFLRTDFQPDGSSTSEDRIGMAPSDVLRIGAFVQDTISLGAEERWTLTPALRFDAYDVSPTNTAAFLNRTIIPGTTVSVEAVDYNNVAIAPSFSALYRWTPQTNTYFTVSRGIRNPTAEELNGVFTHGTDFIVVPNPDLQEEQSNSFEAGFQLARPEHAFQFALFYNEYKDFLESNVLVEDNPDPEPDVLTTVNRAEVEIYGAELRWDYRSTGTAGIPTGAESGFSFSWTKGNQTDIDQPLNTVDPWKAVAYLGFRSPEDAWGSRLTATFIGEKEVDDINQTTNAGAFEPVDSLFLLDWTAFYRLNQHWEINGGIRNITDETYYLWSTARRGGGHGVSSSDRNTQPGINGFLSLTAIF